MQPSFRIGLDVGGTFTDLYLLNEATGQVVRHKLPSTPDNPYEAPVHGFREILEKAGVAADRVGFIGLGTTVATNALLERKGAVTGLITTRGFRDLLEIGRQKRPHVYDLFVDKPEPLASRELRVEVEERIGPDGAVIRPLDEAGLAAAVDALVASGVESVAICFLNSYVDPSHEKLAEATARKHFDFVTASQDLLPEFREYERLSSTVVNAYLMPVMQRYLSRFSREARNLGFRKEPFVMSSGGGVVSPELAGRRPIDTLFSGPSGGVSAAVCLSRATGNPDIVTFDMGGTSTDVCLVRGGRPEVTHSRIVDGLPIKSTAADIHTVGAGGSSIAWIDPGGLLKVGPHSAGAKPGPACYGAGGAAPTVTDANVVLGRLNQDYLLGGTLPIDARKSHGAIRRFVAEPRNIGVPEAAAAILAVSNTSIVQAIRFVSVERGLDPRDFQLVAFGGAGPLHAAEVARELSMPGVLIPESPGVLCAMGVLTKDIQIDLGQTRLLRESSPDLEAAVDDIYTDLEARAAETFAAFEGGALTIERTVDARYVGQNHELQVSAAKGASVGTIKETFHAVHRRLYGYDQPDKELELVTFRIKALLPVEKLDLAKLAAPTRDGPLVPVGRRKVFFEGEGRFLPCPVYDRTAMTVGDAIRGPAIIEQMDTTTVVPPDFAARVDPLRNLVLAQR